MTHHPYLDLRDGSDPTTESSGDSGSLPDSVSGADRDHHRVSTATMRFRRKPVHVDAVQLTQDAINAHVLDGAPLPEGCRVTSSRFHRTARTVEFAAVRLKTPKLELVMPGDWIVRSDDGTFSVCKPDEFEALYEPDFDHVQRSSRTEPPWADLDPGIRATVRALWDAGYEPTDSGDGSKAGTMGCAIETHHVFMRCEPDDLAKRAWDLWVLVSDWPSSGDYNGNRVEASYSPADGVGVLMLFGCVAP